MSSGTKRFYWLKYEFSTKLLAFEHNKSEVNYCKRCNTKEYNSVALSGSSQWLLGFPGALYSTLYTYRVGKSRVQPPDLSSKTTASRFYSSRPFQMCCPGILRQILRLDDELSSSHSPGRRRYQRKSISVVCCTKSPLPAIATHLRTKNTVEAMHILSIFCPDILSVQPPCSITSVQIDRPPSLLTRVAETF